ncbi:MAG: Ig-like domain-containing protein, partial [Leptospiraceae bacterium]|nr:Ig-like domain-containing protein [Leptospiraceae bacterium]
MSRKKVPLFTKLLFSSLLTLLATTFCLRNADVSQNSLLTEVEKIESGTSASTAPTLTSVNPADGQTGVATSTSIVLTFNTEMNTSTLIAQSVSGACTGSVLLSNDNFINCVGFQTNPVNTENKTFKYTLAGNLNITTQYRLKVTTSVKNTNGQSMTSDYVQSTGFQTGSGATTPSVISVTPNNNQTGVGTSSTISVTFSETMTPGTFTQTASDGTCTGSAQLQIGPGFTDCKGISLNSSDNINLTITPSSALAENTQYRLVFTTAIQSAGGIALASNFQSVFTTGDFTSPSVTNVTAAQSDGTYGVGSSLTIRVVFSENVVVTGTPTLQLETGTTDQTISYSSGSGSNTLEFLYSITSREDVNNDLDYVSTTSLLVAGGAIKDNAGNNANLTLPAPAIGAAGSLSTNKNIRIFTFNLPDT